MQTPSHVVMVGTSFETRSEVGSVVDAYRQAGLFERWPIDYVESHREGSRLLRCLKALDGLCIFVALLCRHPRAVLHVHSAGTGMSFWRKSVFMALALLARWPVVFHLHGTGFATFYDAKCSMAGRALVRFFLDRAACIVVVSPRWCAWMNRVSRNPHVVALAPPVTLPPPSAEREPLLVVDASSDAKGGSAELARAVAQLADSHPGLRIERTYGLGPRAREHLFARAAAVVLADHAEGLPLRLLEAMAAGAPVVASAVGGITDVVDHGFNGFLVPPRDSGAIASTLRRVLDNPALVREMGRAARATIAHRFSTDRALEGLDRIYHRLDVARTRPQAAAPRATPPLFPQSLTAARRYQEN